MITILQDAGMASVILPLLAMGLQKVFITEHALGSADVIERNGSGSQATSCFVGVVHAAASSASFSDAVRNTAMAGGETCGRAQLVSQWP